MARRKGVMWIGKTDKGKKGAVLRAFIPQIGAQSVGQPRRMVEVSRERGGVQIAQRGHRARCCLSVLDYLLIQCRVLTLQPGTIVSGLARLLAVSLGHVHVAEAIGRMANQTTLYRGHAVGYG